MINFSFGTNGKFIIFRCPKIWEYYSLIMMCLNTGTPKNHHFPSGTNGKVMVLGVPILKHFRVIGVCYFHFFGVFLISKVSNFSELIIEKSGQVLYVWLSDVSACEIRTNFVCLAL